MEQAPVLQRRSEGGRKVLLWLVQVLQRINQTGSRAESRQTQPHSHQISNHPQPIAPPKLEHPIHHHARAISHGSHSAGPQCCD